LLKPLVGAAEILAREGWQAILPLATSLSRDDVVAALGTALPSLTIAEGDTYNIVAAADAAVVKSGTATLETALLGCPTVIVYRLAWTSYIVARALVHVEWIGMANIILQRSVFPELIQKAVTAGAIAAKVRTLTARRTEMQKVAAELREKLGGPGAADRAAQFALELLE
jgi:lipid-A-disaccharide synthase